MEKRLGRYLTADEVVHHLNHIRSDNRDENLELHGSNGEHVRAEHGRGVCSVPGCGKPHKYRGYCNGHATWSRSHGWQAPTHLLGTGVHSWRRGGRGKVGPIAGAVDPSVPRAPAA